MASILTEVKYLMAKDMRQEWRQRYALNGILLYVVAAVFVTYLSVKINDKPTWNAIFWIIILFTSVSSAAKSFIQESRGRWLYYYQVASPQAIIISKMLHNSILMMVMSLLCFAFFSLLLGNPADNIGMFLLVVFLGSLGFSAVLSMTSAIASKAGNSNLLMPVLSIPSIIPLLLVTIKASKKAIDGLAVESILKDCLVLFAFYLAIAAMAYVLFSFLWKE
jgi:heme exporter protein B